jgi:hypothetical protein
VGSTNSVFTPDFFASSTTCEIIFLEYHFHWLVFSSHIKFKYH